MNIISASRRIGVAATVLVIISLLMGPSPAAAHDGLVSSVPIAGSTVTTEIESISLTFSDELLDLGDMTAGFAIQVVGPDGRYYNLDCVQREGAVASTLVALGESGTYKVTWQVISSDAHTTSDTFDFVYERPAEAVAAIGTTTLPCSSGGSPGPTEGMKETTTGGENSTRGTPPTEVGNWVTAGGVVAVLLVLAAVFVTLALRRKRRRGSRYESAE